MTFDLIIIGAGAAGLMAAIRAAELGLRVLLLEKNKKLGVKILMSGGTRCNITQNTDKLGIVEAFGTQGSFLHSALSKFSTSEIIEVLNREGVKTKVESTGKVFPESDRAIDVRDALVQRLKRSKARIINQCPVIECRKVKNHFEIACENEKHLGNQLLITTGGKSYPGCGTTGDGYAWAKTFGHKLVLPRPALTPLTTNVKWPKSLSGVTVGDVHCEIELRIHGQKNRDRNQARGSLLFTHFGFSGPAALNISREWINSKSKLLLCDFVPSKNSLELSQHITQIKRSSGKKSIGSIALDWVPNSLFASLLNEANIPSDTRCAEISKSQVSTLVHQLKQCQISISGIKGFEKAEVTAGGIPLDEVDSRTMQSKIVPGLYFAGEILDLDGPIGGYNFQAAFSTAWLAATSAARVE